MAKDDQSSDLDPRKGKASASEAHRIVACPGYLFAKENWEKIEEPQSEIATSGQNTHEAIDCIIDGRPIEIPLREIEEFVATRCADMHDKLLTDLLGSKDAIKKSWTKKRLWLSVGGENFMSGEPDWFGTDKQGTWVVVDHKRGPKEVPVATKNWQVQTYSTMVAYDESIPDLPTKKIYGAIFQPLVSSKPIVVEMSLDDCFGIRAKLYRAVLYGRQKNSPRIPGEHCTYCPVRHTCPQAQSAGLILAHKFNDIGSLSNDQLTALYPKMNRVIDLAEAVKKAFKARVAAGQIPGWEMYDHPTGHTIADPSDLYSLVREYIEAEEFRAMLTTPIGTIRDKWIDEFSEMAGCTKSEAMDAWREQIEPHLTVKPPQKRVRKIKNEHAEIPKEITEEAH